MYNSFSLAYNNGSSAFCSLVMKISENSFLVAYVLWAPQTCPKTQR